MKPRMARALVLLYPRAWRQRYGDEFAALLAQQRLTPAAFVDVTYGACDARLRALHQRQQRGERKRPMMRGAPKIMKCSFCGKDQTQVKRLIAGPNYVFICDECIALCNEILAETPPQPSDGEPPAKGSGQWQISTNATRQRPPDGAPPTSV